MRTEYLKSIEKVNTIKNLFLRDTVWLIYLKQITSIEGYFYTFSFNDSIDSLIEWVNKLNQSNVPSPKENLPLGKYAELLIQFYLMHHSNYKLHVANLQIIEENVTIGELDFLFDDLNKQETIHLEFSIKYYLKTKKLNKTIFLGPSTKDWMERKISKLISKQTQLSMTHKHLFPDELKNNKYTPKAMIKGCLFYHWKVWNTKRNTNPLNEGWWAHLDNLSNIDSEDCNFRVELNKRNWIFPFTSNFKALTISQLKTTVKIQLIHTNEIMVIRYTKVGTPIDRGFIMRNNWPIKPQII